MRFEWEVVEHEHCEKTVGWFLVVGGGMLILILLAVLMKNFLLGVLILLGGLALILHALTPSEKADVLVTRHGIQIKQSLYPYEHLHSFWIHDDQPNKKVTLRSAKGLTPNLHLPLPNEFDHEELRLFLLERLPEKRHEPNLVDALVEYL
ncbi:MAG: hypothetical protein AAB505_02085 [Patescibacteria group bacterium]